VADRELLGGDDAFGLVADVEQDLIVVDANDAAGDDVAIIEVLEGGLDGLCQLVGGEIALGRLGGARCSLVVDGLVSSFRPTPGPVLAEGHGAGAPRRAQQS
jgi:hypothetical protein